MIQFRWSAEDDEKFRIAISTPVVRVGTLHRLTAAIYILGLDIESGVIDTIERDGTPHTEDSFLLRPDRTSNRRPGSLAEISARLGMLMETLLQREVNPDQLFVEHLVQPPDGRQFFESPPEVLFQEDSATQTTQFYIETGDRSGLLYHLTSLLTREGIDILRGTIATLPAGRAEDTLYLQHQSEPLSDELIAAILEQLNS